VKQEMSNEKKNQFDKGHLMPNLNKSSEADKWAEQIIAQWQLLKKNDIPEVFSKRNDFIIEIKTFLSSLPPKIKKEAHLKGILEVLKDLMELQMLKNIEVFIPHFIIH
jgi:peroxiredoxin